MRSVTDVIRGDQLSRNSLYLISSMAVTSVLGFVFWIYAARLHTEASIGLGATLVSASQLIASFSLLGLNAAVIRFLPTSPRPSQFVRHNVAIISAAGLLVGVLYVIVAPSLIEELRQLWSWQGAIFIVLTIAGAVFLYMDSAFLALGDGRQVLRKNSLSSLGKLPLAPLFSAAGTVGVFVAATLPNLAATLVSARSLSSGTRRRKDTRSEPIVGSVVARFATGNHIAFVANAAPPLVLPSLVVAIVGAEATAHLYMALAIAGAIFWVPVASAQSLFAEGSRHGSDLKMLAVRGIKFIALLLAPAVAALVLAADWLLSLMGESYARGATATLQLLTLSAVPLSFNAVSAAVLRVKDRTAWFSSLSVARALGQVVLAVILISSIGLSGAGVAWIAGETAVLPVYVTVALASIRDRSGSQ